MDLTRQKLLTRRDIARLRGDHAKVADLTRQIAALATEHDTTADDTTPTPTTKTEE